jgi:DNA-binding transcriptional ArsR family regulator
VRHFYLVKFAGRNLNRIFAARKANPISTLLKNMNKHYPPAVYTASHDQQRASNKIMRALAHPLRLRIVQFIDAQTSACVNDIHKAVDIEQSIASQHLRILRMAELVHTRREGKFVFYSIDYEKLREAARIAAQLAHMVEPE